MAEYQEMSLRWQAQEKSGIKEKGLEDKVNSLQRRINSDINNATLPKSCPLGFQVNGQLTENFCRRKTKGF